MSNRLKLTLLLLLASVAQATGQRLQSSTQTWQPIRLPVEFWRASTPGVDTVRIYIVGDIISHTKVRLSAEEHGYGSFFKHVAGRIEAADVTVGNLEFPLAGEPYSGYPVFSGPDSFAQALSDAGFDVLLTANNHILDKGSEGLSRTIRVLEQLGIPYTGTAASAAADTLLNPLIVKVKGLEIALVNFTYGTNSGAQSKWPVVHYMNKERLEPVLRRARKAHFVLAFPHWGVEYAPRHNASQEEMARWLVSQGVDVVIGGHPHVVQDTDVIDGVPVYYSLGNGLTNQNDLPARLEAALTIKIVCKWGEDPVLLPPQMELLWCTKPGMIEDGYAAVPVTLPKEYWRVPEDYDNMTRTLASFMRNE